MTPAETEESGAAHHLPIQVYATTLVNERLLQQVTWSWTFGWRTPSIACGAYGPGRSLLN